MRLMKGLKGGFRRWYPAGRRTRDGRDKLVFNWIRIHVIIHTVVRENLWYRFGSLFLRFMSWRRGEEAWKVDQKNEKNAKHVCHHHVWEEKRLVAVSHEPRRDTYLVGGMKTNPNINEKVTQPIDLRSHFAVILSRFELALWCTNMEICPPNCGSIKNLIRIQTLHNVNMRTFLCLML